jgi:hypothetical protein
MLLGRNWRAIAGAAVSASLLVALTLVIWGWPVWQAFLDSLPLTRSVIIEQGVAGFFKIMTPFAAVRMWGGSIGVAYSTQSAVTILSLAAVAFISVRPERPALRNALVCAAAILATPYAMDYDLVVLLPALAWLYADGREHRFLPWGATIMASIWITPLFARSAAEFLYVPLGMISALAVGAIALRRLLRGRAMTIGDVHPG